MKKSLGKRISALILLAFLLTAYGLPFASYAAEETGLPFGPPPAEPLEKAVFQQGGWNTEYMDLDDKETLLITYTGSRTVEKDPMAAVDTPVEEWTNIADIKLKSKILLRGIYVPFTYPVDQVPAEKTQFYMMDDKGNVYGPYPFTSVKNMKAKDIYETQKSAAEEGVLVSVDPNAVAEDVPDRVEYDNVFIADSQIMLPAGKYALYVTNGSGVVKNKTNDYKSSVFVKGVDYNAWKKYRMEYLKWEQEQNEVETYSGSGDEVAEGDVVISVDGNQELSDAAGDPEKDYPVLVSVASTEFKPAVITLKQSSVIEEIVFNTSNGGKGAAPGIITVTDEKGQLAGSFQASGGSLGGVANGIWRAGPGVVFPAGTYTLACSDPAAVGYLQDGSPDFYVAAAPAPPEIFNFTGRYFIDASVVKTSTLMGPVTGGTPSFTLNSFELTVLDRGESIELIGKYEGMPFSQVCQVTAREANKLEATFNFAADLTKLPYKAKITAACNVVLNKTQGQKPTVEIKGIATYDRKATKNKGADFNTYDVTAKGSQADKVLPAYVAAALAARTPGAGNVPGPANGTQAAVGALFPPLVGLVVQVIQSMIKKREEEVEEAEHGPKKPKHKLGAAEQAMADANNSLGQGLFDEKEAAAWGALGAALGNSDNPDNDPESVGDNEKPGGSDYNPGQDGQDNSGGEGGDSSNDTGGQEDGGPEEDNTFGKPDVPPEAPVGRPEDGTVPEQPGAAETQPGTEPKTGDSVLPPETRVVQIDHTGRTAEIQYDAARGTWVNTESGRDFDMGRYERDVAPSFGKDKAFTDEQRHNQETGNTATDRELDRIRKERDEKLAQIQKEINDRRRDEIKSETERAVKEAEAAGSTWSVLSDTIKNIRNELADTKKTLSDGAASVIKEVKQAGKEVWNDPSILTTTFTNTIKDIGNAVSGAVKDAAGAVSDIYKQPEILTGTLRGSWNTVKDGVKSTGKEIITTVTDPKKAWTFVKETTGLENFGNSLDPNRTLIDRLTQVGIGTVKLGSTILTAGEAAATARSGATKLGGILDDALGAGGGRAAGAGGSAAETLGSGRILGPKAGKMEVNLGENYAASGKAPDLAGVTDKSRTAIQNVADKHGVQIHTRPTTESASDWLKSGKAVPKDYDMKAKTLDKIDELIGGPKNREGVVGYFKPEKPPESIMEKLSPDMRADITKRYNQRLEEFDRLKDKMGVVGEKPPWTSVDGRYNIDANGLVRDMKNEGKLITGDVDIYDITSFDGKPLPENVKQMVWKELKTVSPSNVKHGNLTSWDVSDPYDINAKIKMINDARPGGKGINTFSPNAAPTHSYQNGPQIVNMRDQVQKLGSNAAK